MRVENHSVFAETIKGGEVCLGKKDGLLGAAWMDSIVDVTGATDGARSVAYIVTPCLETSMSKTEAVRLKDTAQSVSRAFNQARLRVPDIDEPSTLARAASLFTGKSGPDLYTYAEGAVKKIYGALTVK